MSISVAIVVPTRNRADLAIEAVRSLLAVADPRLRNVIVSDNSSEPDHLRQLGDFCDTTADARLLRIRPPSALAMAQHWDWAIEATLAQTAASHIGLHYDRRISTPSLQCLFDVAERRPELPVTYLLDVVHAASGRFHVHQMQWSGGVYEIRTARALALAAAGRLTDLWQVFPVLVNGLVPRGVFARVRERFGSICASTSPECCFGFRLAATTELYLHYDRPLGIHYGSARSNGLGYMRGDRSGAFGDFVRLHGDRPWLEAAPLPGVSLGQNSFYHEYALARRDAGALPPIEMEGYLADLARGLCWIGDAAQRSELRALLVRHGWSGKGEQAAPPARPAKGVRAAMARFRADHLAARPSDFATVGFRREARALRYAAGHERAPEPNDAFLRPLEPVRLS